MNRLRGKYDAPKQIYLLIVYGSVGGDPKTDTELQTNLEVMLDLMNKARYPNGRKLYNILDTVRHSGILNCQANIYYERL